MTVNNNILRSRLESERKRILDELKGIEDSSRPTDVRREGSPFGKREEEATESFELEKRLALDSRLRNDLREIEQAIRKFDAGTYGICDICGLQIDTARLEALPQANLCLKCKSKSKSALR